MKRSCFLSLVLVSVSSTALFSQTAAAPLQTTRDQASYAIGLRIGRDLTQDGAELDPQTVLRGIQDVLNNRKLALSEEQCRAALTAFQREMQARVAEQRRSAGVKNRQAGEAFLAENKRKPGVTTLPSGLQIQVLKRGTGPSPKESDNVTTHYHGTFIDGKVFDSSVQRGEPATFNVGGVIPGWTEALQRMKVGGKWKLFVPSDLAYGPNGRQGIEPNTVLLFEVELLAIE